MGPFSSPLGENNGRSTGQYINIQQYSYMWEKQNSIAKMLSFVCMMMREIHFTFSSETLPNYKANGPKQNLYIYTHIMIAAHNRVTQVGLLVSRERPGRTLCTT